MDATYAPGGAEGGVARAEDLFEVPVATR